MPANLMSGLGADGFAVDHAYFGHEFDMHGHFQRGVSAPFSFLFHDHTLDDFDVPNKPIVISPIRHAFEAASWNRYFDSLYRKLSEKLGYGDDGVLSVGRFDVDLINARARVGCQEMDLSPRTYSVLRALAVHGRDDYVSQETLFQHVFSDRSDIGLKNITIQISKLNQAIRSAASDDFLIKNMRSKGYSLVERPATFTPFVNGIEFSEDARMLRAGNRVVDLTPKETKALSVLRQFKGHKVSLYRIQLETGSKNTEALKVGLDNVRHKMKSLVGGHHIEKASDDMVILVDTPIFDRAPTVDFKPLVGGVKFCFGTRQLRFRNKKRSVSPRVAKALKLLSENMDHVISREDIQSAVSAKSIVAVQNIIDSARKVIKEVSGEDHIKTVKGQGFVLQTPPVKIGAMEFFDQNSMLAFDGRETVLSPSLHKALSYLLQHRVAHIEAIRGVCNLGSKKEAMNTIIDLRNAMRGIAGHHYVDYRYPSQIFLKDEPVIDRRYEAQALSM
ncbi:MAG: winged helix-turn-helix domain-containing protein [Alphaproteobacteria bacterium]|nr:winged helix-turn-helix domain-containing protein [Alphaproteobacteria bacterium]